MYIQCDNGRAYEFPCPNPLIFDVKVGSCVRKEQASELARLCDGEVFNEVDGFSCPGGDVVGPQNLLQAHPIHAHPTDCRYYFSCYHNKEPNKFGCSEGNVFDRITQVCKPAEEVDNANAGMLAQRTVLAQTTATQTVHVPRPFTNVSNRRSG